MQPDVWFYNIGIRIYNLPRVAFSLFGLEIFWYGIIIVLAVCTGYFIAMKEARNTGQNPQDYSDLLLWVVPICTVGARLYFIIFTPGMGLGDFFNFRGGGLAIYGVVLVAVPTAIIFAKIRKLNVWQLTDTAVLGLIGGQIIGRWGNFINREAYGTFTEGMLAMRYRVDQLSHLPQELTPYIMTFDGVEYIQVHPTFLYESLYNFILLSGLYLYRKHKSFNGELLMIYFIWYGTGRAFLETLRTDSLMIGNFRTSIITSVILAAIGIIGMIYGRMGYFGALENTENPKRKNKNR